MMTHDLNLNEMYFSYLYGRAEGDAPAGFFQLGESPEMIPGSRTQTIDGVNINEIWAEMTTALAAYNQLADAKTALLTFPVVRATDQVGVPRNPGFQRATEFGRPSKIRVETLERAYPLDHFDLGYGYTQEYLDYAPSSTIVALNAEIMSGWTMLRRNTVLAALFDNVNGTQEALSVKRLYNADGEIPPKFKRFTHDGTHSHYLTDDGFDATTLAVIEEELVHHGFGEFGEQLIVFASMADMATLRALAGFIPAESGKRPAILDGSVIGPTATAAGALTAEGYFGRLILVEDLDIPDGYLLGIATGGTFATRNVLGLRVHENASARGLRLIEGPNGRYPLIDAVYDGYLGAGVRQRGAAVIVQDTAGAYEVPEFGAL